MSAATVSLVASWMTIALAMSLLSAVAAMAAQRLALNAVPARLVWGFALVGALGVTGTQPLRRATSVSATSALPAATSLTPIVGEAYTLSTMDHAVAALDRMRRAPAAAVDGLAQAASSSVQALPTPLQRALGLVWPVSSLLVLLVLALSYRRSRALLGRTEPALVRNTPVHLSGTVGPVVIGAVKPAIVVPWSLLERSTEEQELVVAHEQAHIDARDPMLLLAGCLVVALMPWNVAAWFMLGRLRLAIELDCDARVLAHGASTRRYGQLLIELSAATPLPRIPLAAPAFSYRPSHLERRLRTMTARPTRFLAARRAAALLVSSTALLAACGAELPTSAELQGMDVAKAESRLGQVVKFDERLVEYVVDGSKVSAEKARGISSALIEEIRIVGAEKSNAAQILIRTKGTPLTGTMEERVVDGSVTIRGDSIALKNITTLGKPSNGQVNEVRIARAPNGVVMGRPLDGSLKITPSTGPEPLFVIDGKRMTKAEMDKLSPTQIESIQILKNASAVALYGTDGANGVVVVTLKK
jgi:TonB-dependent SusC/RagA subfamily outer membrane receptor